MNTFVVGVPGSDSTGQKQGAFDKLPEIRAKDEQIYLDIIGDSGHAVRGLELALGRGKVAW